MRLKPRTRKVSVTLLIPTPLVLWTKATNLLHAQTSQLQATSRVTHLAGHKVQLIFRRMIDLILEPVPLSNRMQQPFD